MTRRAVVASLFVTFALLMPASAAWGHAEFEPDEAAPGSVASVALHVENERSNAGTVKVQLIFMPGDQRITVAALPLVPGWTAIVEGGAVGGAPATGVTWSRPTATAGDNPDFPITLGPLPDRTGQLVFNVVQTYSNGDIVRWEQQNLPGIDSEFPAPVIELTPGAPGVIPSSTTPSTTPSTTSAPTTSVVPTPTTVAPESDDDDDSNAVPIIIGIAILIALGVAGGILWDRRRRRP